jgi:excisionase family DNA binding protein
MEPSSKTSSQKAEILKRFHQSDNLTEEDARLIEDLVDWAVDEKQDTPDPLWTIEDVFTRLDVGKRTVEKIIDAGGITPIWIRGQRRFEPEAIEAYLRRNVGKK